MSDKPEIAFPEGAPPSDLEITDIVVGDGDEAKAGHTATVHYVGIAFSTGEEFDASYNGGKPFSFPLGKRRVIAGWDRGVEGMKVGGRGAGGAIKPGETLIFVVDLLGVR